MESRNSPIVSLISIAGGALLAFIGYRTLSSGGGNSLFEAARELGSLWPLFITILGAALVISGVTGLLRSR